MRFLTARRRHPAAKGLVLVFALLVMGALYATLAPSTKSAADTGTSQQVAEGKALFAVSCASCHGLNGEGQVSGSIQGPPLAGVGAAAVEFQVATGRMPMAHPGPQAQTKPSQFTEDEVLALAAYVATLGPGPAIPEPEQYDPAQGNASDGALIFRTNCAMCHNFAGKGGALTRGKYAPNLEGVTPKHIYEAMITGPQSMPVFNDQTMPEQSKRDVIAFLQDVEENQSPGGLDLGAIGPVGEGMVVWTFGLGLLIGCAIWLGAKSK